MYGNRIGRFLCRTRLVKAILRHKSVSIGEQMVSPSSRCKIAQFVTMHQVNMEEALIPSIEAYACFNDFFIRQLDPLARPIDQPDQANRACCPADCRLIVFDSVNDSKQLWIKGCAFTLSGTSSTRESVEQSF